MEGPNADRDWAERVAREAALGRPRLRRVTAAVGEETPEDRAIAAVLRAVGCKVEPRWRRGIPAFSGSRGGERLAAQDEKGALLDSGQLLAILTLIEMENGCGQVAVPPGATAAVDLVAAGYGGDVLRLERDGREAQDLYESMPWLWYAPSAAARICHRMGVSAQSLEALGRKTPRFQSWKREVPILSDRQEVLETLLQMPCGAAERGARLRTDRGWVYLYSLPSRSALRVVAEGPDLELAAELCDFYAGRAARLDRRLASRRGK